MQFMQRITSQTFLSIVVPYSVQHVNASKASEVEIVFIRKHGEWNFAVNLVNCFADSLGPEQAKEITLLNHCQNIYVFKL